MKLIPIGACQVETIEELKTAPLLFVALGSLVQLFQVKRIFPQLYVPTAAEDFAHAAKLPDGYSLDILAKMLITQLQVARQLQSYVKTLHSSGHGHSAEFDKVFETWLNGNDSDLDAYEQNVF